MSNVQIEVVTISAINPHPGADRLEIAEVLGTQCCVPIGKFKVGDLALWFPPTLLIPEPVATALGVAQYLKHSAYPGDTVQSKSRVAACRMRGTPSFGFIISLDEANRAAAAPLDSELVWRPMPDGLHVGKLTDADPTPRLFSETIKAGDNVDAYFKACKYEPPIKGDPSIPRPKGFNADAAPDNENFHKYTDIQHFYKYAPALPEGTPVRITEKLHGMNVRLGLVRVGETDEFTFQAGSHKVNWKPEDSKGNVPIWWQLMTENVVNALTELCDERNSVVIFGELYGPGIQDMDYGAEEFGFRVFDISLNRQYLSWEGVKHVCTRNNIELVPLLYEGPFSKEVLTQHTYGPTTMSEAGKIKARFKDREGCVVTPLEEEFSRYLGGRLILKSVSADYLDRKGAQDN
jgi:RNA ligase (TIGR02306 family)